MMDKVLEGIPNVGCYIDDVIITGRSTEDCYTTATNVLKALGDHNITLKEEKCKFFRDSVVYLGHKVSEEGIYPTAEKIKAVRDAPEPSNITELRAYLGDMAQHLKQDTERRNDHRGPAEFFSVGDGVYVKTTRGERVSWQEGTVEQVVSPVTYMIRVQGRLQFTHVDHLRQRKTSVWTEATSNAACATGSENDGGIGPGGSEVPRSLSQDLSSRRGLSPKAMCQANLRQEDKIQLRHPLQN
ncbi:hypothetical protein MTO96_049980 [Rhipicephalus appendiculatus]